MSDRMTSAEKAISYRKDLISGGFDPANADIMVRDAMSKDIQNRGLVCENKELAAHNAHGPRVGDKMFMAKAIPGSGVAVGEEVTIKTLGMYSTNGKVKVDHKGGSEYIDYWVPYSALSFLTSNGQSEETPAPALIPGGTMWLNKNITKPVEAIKGTAVTVSSIRSHPDATIVEVMLPFSYKGSYYADIPLSDLSYAPEG